MTMFLRIPLSLTVHCWLSCSAANWLKPPGIRRHKPLADRIPSWLHWRYMRNNLPLIVFLVVFFVVNIVLFVEAAVRHRDKGE